MNKILLVLLAINMNFMVVGQDKKSDEGINWVSINELPALQAKEKRKVFIDVYTNWCGPCKMMMKNTFTDKGIIKYINQNYYAVKFNAEGNEEITFKETTYKNPTYDPAKTAGRNGTHDFAGIAAVEGRLAYPTLVFLDEDLNLIGPLQGYRQADQLFPFLEFFKDEIYKKNKFDIWLECQQ